MSSSSGTYSGSNGHMCTYETCVLRISLTVDNFGKRFLGCSQYKVGPKCPFFKWNDNPTCVRRNEAAHFVQQKMDLPVSCKLHMKGKEQLPRQQQKLPKW
ncbi:hypothetical protein SO802_017651 [Lithocarpus litseifolius]|uniref:GRF-type domain-containing protein n=1 Tax=Lithocarpus litseifolius TaxID=425828 RepID=A0AAW2CJ23_9ROSI